MVCRLHTEVEINTNVQRTRVIGGDKGFDRHRSGGCERAAVTVDLFQKCQSKFGKSTSLLRPASSPHPVPGQRPHVPAYPGHFHL